MKQPMAWPVLVSLLLTLSTGGVALADWTIVTVDATGITGSHCALALDSSGYPHIVYNDTSLGTVKYAYEDTAGWHAETVVTYGSAGLELSIAMDAGDRAHITYFYGADSHFQLNYAIRTAPGWIHQIIDGNGWMHASVAVDSGHHPHVAYFDNGNTSLLYAFDVGAGWQTRTVDSGPSDLGRGAELALSPFDNPHIAYKDLTVGLFNYQFHDGSNWRYELIDLGAGHGGGLDIAMDVYGMAYVAYYDHTFHSLKLAERWASGWHVETVDSAGDVGWNASIALHHGGYPPEAYPHISYQDVTSKNLKYFYKDHQDWWVVTVDSGADVGYYSSIATSPTANDSVAYAHIAYYDTGLGTLKYATNKPAGHNLTVDVYTNQAYFRPGDAFGLHLDVLNSGPSVSQNVYLVLDVVGNYWFWPSWGAYPPNVDFATWILPSGWTYDTALQFTWPSTGQDTASGLQFHAALMDVGTSNLRDFDSCAWGFGP